MDRFASEVIGLLAFVLLNMNPIIRETLAENAYRTLGLSGSASQSEIEAAARKMRIWPDASRIPSTPWDLPALGPVRRSKPDIERAVAVLNQPRTRLEHRLLWFCGKSPPPDPVVSLSSITERHAKGVAGLQAIWADCRDSDDGTRWSPAIAWLLRVFGSPGFVALMREIEQAGKFDKPNSLAELSDAITAVPVAVAAGAVHQAIAALNDNRLYAFSLMTAAILQVPPTPPANPARDLLDHAEDSFNAKATEMEEDLRENLRTNHQNPVVFHATNFEHSTRAAVFYDNHMSPMLDAMVRLSSSDPDRLLRIKSRSGELLVLLALGWEWSGRYIKAERQLQSALEIAGGTVAELEIHRAIERVSPLAKNEVKPTTYQPADLERQVPRRLSRRAKFRKRSAQVGLGLFAVYILGHVFVEGLWGPSSITPMKLPDLNIQLEFPKNQQIGGGLPSATEPIANPYAIENPAGALPK